MTRKVRGADQMSDYFATRGSIQKTLAEYRKDNDGPMRPEAIKRVFGSWSRMLSICNRMHLDRMTIARQVKEEPKVELPPADFVPERQEQPVTTVKQALEKLGQ